MPITTCVICHAGRVAPGTTTVTLTRGSSTIVIRSVPAEVCDACGEACFSEAISRDVEQIGNAAIDAGVLNQVSEYRRRVA